MKGRYAIRRCFRDKTMIWETGYTREQALAHVRDPNCASDTATNPKAVDYTRRNGPWFDVMEPAPFFRWPWLRLRGGNG